MFDIHQMQDMQAKMQERLEKIQDEMKGKRIEGKAGGGAMRVVCDGNQEILTVEIADGVVDLDAEDIEMLQDLFIAAANQAIEQSKKINQESLAPLTGGLHLPGLTL